MNSIIAEIERAVAAAKTALDRAASPADIEAVRIEYLSRNGLFPALSRRMGEVPPEERRETGTAFNTGRAAIEEALDAARSRLTAAADRGEEVDVTLSGRRGRLGHKHPISQLADECVRMGRSPMPRPAGSRRLCRTVCKGKEN